MADSAVDRSAPFVGPRSFERGPDDRWRFFGRRRESAELATAVMAYPVTVLFAASGAGKTSLLNAGATPRLESAGLTVLPAARPGRTKLLEGVAQGPVDNRLVLKTLVDLLPGALPTSLAGARLAEGLGSPKVRPGVVAILDQFEEIFYDVTESGRRERNAFIEQIAEAVRRIADLRVVIGIREDFLAELEPFERFFEGGLRVRLRLERLGRDAALSALMDPVAAVGGVFTAEAAEAVVDELTRVRVTDTTIGGPTAEDGTYVTGSWVEPVHLQVVGQQLWESLPAGTATIERRQVTQSGDVDTALRRLYEDAIGNVVAKGLVSSEAQLRNFFGQQLVTSVHTRGAAIASDAATLGVSGVALEALEDRHIIRSETRAGARWYELTHDRMIGPVETANREWFSDSYRRADARARERTTAPTGPEGGPTGRLRRRSSHGRAADPVASPALGTGLVDLNTPCGDSVRPASPPSVENGPPVGVALSGGGFRSTLVSLGVFRFLADAGLLNRPRYVSAVSSGSIALSLVAVAWPQVRSAGYATESVDRLIIEPAVERIQSGSLMGTLRRRLWRTIGSTTRTDLFSQALDRWWFDGVELEDLDPEVRWIVSAANITTGVRFGFERDTVGDYVSGLLSTTGSGLRLSLAIGASSAIPGVFARVRLPEHLVFPCGRADSPPELIDGTVYDNTGTELFESARYRDVFTVSVNSGGVFPVGPSRGLPVLRDVLRANALLYRQSMAVRTRWAVDRLVTGERRGLLLALASDVPLDSPRAAQFAATFPEHRTWDGADLAFLPTTYGRLDERLCRLLIYRGWWLTGANLARWYPEMLPHSDPAAPPL